ncbi:carbon-nitrogen family hydrolase [Marinicrinis sediminis]|uniref:Carbon-nitrogen family hydrolase n=1 Tax=Marinicrinis sediminis TaxID=1652465 RepID=A0ABW5REG4_9BACL
MTEEVAQNNKTFQVALIQYDVQIGEPDVNADRVLEWMEQAVQHDPKPDVILLPEMWNTGYALTELQDLADENGIRTKNMMSAFCRKHQVNVIAGSVSEWQDGKAYNTMYVFDRDGREVSSYSKIHLFRLMDEEKYLAEGQRVGSFDVEGISAGMMICYDIRFPELSRKLALGGAQILFVPAEWPNPRLAHWRTLLLARAIENQMYVVACNRTGQSGETSFFGHSMVIDPWGDIVAEGDEREQIIHATIDLSNVDKVRKTIPIFEDRRPKLYE